MWYNLSVGLMPASSPGRGAFGEEAKFTGCQSLSYQERLCNGRPSGKNEAPLYFP